VILVASDPLVLSVGGTTLDASHKTGAWIGESAWGLPYGDPGSFFQASGGGFSRLFARPSYQNDVAGIGAMRGVPDVAADANPHTGFPVVTSDASGSYTISGHGGTSAAAPPGPRSSPSPTSTRSATSASSTRPSTRSPAVRTTTRPSTTSRWATTRPSSPTRRSPVTEQARAGTPSPAGAVRTPRYLFPCSLATRAADETTDPY